MSGKGKKPSLHRNLSAYRDNFPDMSKSEEKYKAPVFMKELHDAFASGKKVIINPFRRWGKVRKK